MVVFIVVVGGGIFVTITMKINKKIIKTKHIISKNIKHSTIVTELRNSDRTKTTMKYVNGLLLKWIFFVFSLDKVIWICTWR